VTFLYFGQNYPILSSQKWRKQFFFKQTGKRKNNTAWNLID